MRTFIENDLARAERQLQEAERHAARQRAVVRRLEAEGESSEVQTAHEHLAELERRVELARAVLKRQRSKP